MRKLTDSRLCVLCRGGSRRLCGLEYCPVLIRTSSLYTLKRVSHELSSTSPPSVYVGWVGYPRVVVAAGLPPEVGDTSVYDQPEKWLGLPLDEVLRFRLTLIRGGRTLGINDVNSSFVDKIREIALSSKPVDVEVFFEKSIRPKVLLDEHVPPMGPLAPVKRLDLGSNPYVNRHVEKVYGDRDLDARGAILYLYTSSVPVSTIMRVLSVGSLGRESRRKLVPTRWAITAVDSTISEALIKKIVDKPTINDFRLYYLSRSGNLFIAILLPTRWMFEWMEAWFPGSTWNLFGGEVVVEGDWEVTSKRREYPSIGGCYYASRLAVAEYLNKLGRQAGAVLYREIYPSFNVPVGVWFVREMVRALLSTQYKSYKTLRELLADIRGITKVPVESIVTRSRILSLLIRGKRLFD
ncbi:MAG: Nre family DNA repair protein [Sulfolobales archaeon]